MKAIKRLIPLALAFILSLGCVVCVSAKTFPDVRTSNSYYDAIDVLSDLKVIEGYTDGNFRPDTDVTRWQMALLISKLVTGETDAAKWYSTENTTSFTDVEAYQYLGSINYANEHGIVKGRSAKIFDPNAGINLQEGVTMAVRALGYPSEALDKNWPTSYMSYARTLGLLDGLEMVGQTQTLTRGDTAQLLYNALYAAKYSETGNTSSIMDDVFSEGGTYVLVAVPGNSIIEGIKAKAETAVLCELKEDGTYGKQEELKLSDISDFYKGNDFEKLLGSSFVLKYSDDKLNAFDKNSRELDASALTLVANKSTGKFTVGNSVLYTPVSAYTTAKSSSNEIIIYSTNSAYTAPSEKIGKKALTINDIAGTTDKFDFTLFDDNGDGVYDRGIYNPYTFGTYTEALSEAVGTSPLSLTIGVESSRGEKITNLDPKSITYSGYNNAISGTKFPDVCYTLYNYYPITGKISLEYVADELSNGIISAYNKGDDTIKIGNTSYSIGANIISADKGTVLKNIADAEDYAGAEIKYVEYSSKLLMLDIKIKDDEGKISYKPSVSEHKLYVVKNIDTEGLSESTPYMKVTLYDGGTMGEEELLIYRLNNKAVSAANCDLYANDIVEYYTYNVASSGANYGSLNRIEDSPAYINEGNKKSLDYRRDLETGKEYLVLSTVDDISFKIPVKADGTRIYYMGKDSHAYMVDTLYSGVIPSNVCIYYTTLDCLESNDGAYATFILLKDYVPEESRSRINSFECIYYVDASTRKSSGGAYEYEAYDLVQNLKVTVKSGRNISESGLYLVKTVGIEMEKTITYFSPITYNITNANGTVYESDFVVAFSITNDEAGTISFRIDKNSEFENMVIKREYISLYKISQNKPAKQSLDGIGNISSAKSFKLLTVEISHTEKYYIFIE